ncbi:inositol phospholipid synthesis and fat-storage-inducing TM-domain-containing protein [Aspergillus egyptiacus]|nr:inositol phospholipid synthesis and fat-storage-inducing TM-domain-containing protein [Aspergillus egyptiacus]
MPVPSSSANGSTSTTITPPSRFTLPGTVLLIYPATLLLGSLFSALSPTAHGPQPASASDEPAPINYFARKNNIFNLYFVKVGWIWLTVAFAVLLTTYPASPARSRRQLQALLRYALATAFWYATTQWFFGPAIIDRSFVFTGGKCEDAIQQLRIRRDESGALGAVQEEPLRVYLTAAACKAAGGAWRGGHDVSGHVFMLVLVTAVLGFEGVGVLAQVAQANNSNTAETSGEKGERDVEAGGEMRRWVFRFVGAVAGLSWWMLLMTAIWFHTWLEKTNGLLLSLAAIYTIYFLPRRALPWRNIVGIPGV